MNLTLRGINWKFIAQVGGLTVLFTYLFIFNSKNDNFLDAGQMLVGIILLCLLSAIWLLRGQHSTSPLGIPLLIYCLVFAITSAASFDPRRSFGEGLYLLVAIFLFSISSEMVASGISWRRIFLAIALSGGIYMVFLWIPVITWYRNWLATAPGDWIPSIIYRLPTASVNSYFLNVLLFVAIAGLIEIRSAAGKLISGIYIVSVLGLSFFASTRAAWLGDGFGILLLGFIYLRHNSNRVMKIWKSVRRRAWLLPLIILILLVVVSAGGYVLYRQTIHPTHGDIIDSRTAFWGPAWQTFLAHPILGQGPFTYQDSFLRSDSVPPAGFFPHGHSVPLTILAEIGLIGLLAFLLVYGAAWRFLYKRLANNISGERKLVLSIGAALFLVFSIQGIFDCYHVEPFGLWGMLIVGGTVFGEPTIEKKNTSLARPWWLLFLVAGAMANYVVFKPYFDGVQAANQSDWHRASQLFETAIKLDPNNAIAQQQYALAESVIAENGDLNALDRSIQAFETAARLDPDWAQNHLDLGMLYLKRNQNSSDLVEAVNELKKATQEAPKSPVIWLNLGAALEKKGDSLSAYEAYDQVLTLAPDLANAYFWRSSPLRSKTNSDWLKKSSIPEQSLADLERAVASDPSTSANRVYLAEAYFKAGRMEEAKQQLDEAQLGYITPSDLSLELNWWEAELAAAEGQIQTAAQIGQGVLDSYLFQGLDGPGANSSTTYYAPLAFRRPVMAIEFVPSVQMIRLPDVWGGRMAELARWYKQLGKISEDQKLREELLIEIPDLKIP